MLMSAEDVLFSILFVIYIFFGLEDRTPVFQFSISFTLSGVSG